MIKEVNMFEIAARYKLRFASPKGALSVEQLWDVPLRSGGDFNLDTIAKGASAKVKTFAEESFVEAKNTSKRTEAELLLDIVKYVIETKLADEEVAKNKADNQQERARLINVLAKKEDEALDGLSLADVKKKIAQLEA